jgi:hypothetical protein
MTNTNEHDANKHGPKDECEWMHVRMNNRVHIRERGMQGKRGGGEDADDTHTGGKPTMSCLPTNDTCKQSNSESHKQEQ